MYVRTRLSQDELFKEGQKIFDRIYIGPAGAAKNAKWLKKAGITHILDCGSMNRNHELDHIHYLKWEDMDDDPREWLPIYFAHSHEFIDKGNRSGGILIHCECGISRSTSILMSYLIAKHGFEVDTALDLVRAKRDIANPNAGFMKQLRLYEKIKKMEKKLKW
jgi:protein-tyrosine phosphatase